MRNVGKWLGSTVARYNIHVVSVRLSFDQELSQGQGDIRQAGQATSVGDDLDGLVAAVEPSHTHKFTKIEDCAGCRQTANGWDLNQSSYLAR